MKKRVCVCVRNGEAVVAIFIEKKRVVINKLGLVIILKSVWEKKERVMIRGCQPE